MYDLLKDLWHYFRERRKFWLIPVVIILLIIGILLVFGAVSAVAPFIYTLF
jgi:competence protein ComGC